LDAIGDVRVDWSAAKVSLQLAAWTCLLLLPVGLLLGRWLAWSRQASRPVVEALLLLPLLLPPTVLGFYLLQALAPVSWLGSALAKLWGGPLAFSFTGILIASLLINLPFAVQPMQRAFEAVPQDVREAAWVSGLSHFETFRRIELPLAWPGIVSGLALVFAHTLGEFGVILMVGGSIPSETKTLSIAIYDRVQAFRDGEAAVMSAVLLAFAFATLLLLYFTAQRPSHVRADRT
jgi:molybdate transport system permease protein